jgi:hypothetical protein
MRRFFYISYIIWRKQKTSYTVEWRFLYNLIFIVFNKADFKKKLLNREAAFSLFDHIICLTEKF